MDIASRIKFFMNSIGVGSSLFADTCQIPRPTLSQILNGRNKKISDELIGKIHDAYPQLSVLWLMFGEGEMILDANTRISEPQTGSVIDFEMEQHSDKEHFIDSTPLSVPRLEMASENEDTLSPSSFDGRNHISTPKNGCISVDSISTKREQDSESAPQATISLSKADGARRIVSIMVFYDDNSFESFSPNHSK